MASLSRLVPQTLTKQNTPSFYLKQVDEIRYTVEKFHIWVDNVNPSQSLSLSVVRGILYNLFHSCINVLYHYSPKVTQNSGTAYLKPLLRLWLDSLTGTYLKKTNLGMFCYQPFRIEWTTIWHRTQGGRHFQLLTTQHSVSSPVLFTCFLCWQRRVTQSSANTPHWILDIINIAVDRIKLYSYILTPDL